MGSRSKEEREKYSYGMDRPLKLYKHAKMNHANHYYGQNMVLVFARHNDYAIAVGTSIYEFDCLPDTKFGTVCIQSFAENLIYYCY